METSAKAIYHALSLLTQATADLPETLLLPIERQALGGTFFLQAPWFVEQVARAIGRRPEIFPDRPIEGHTLQAMQERADAWLLLRRAAEHLCQLATDQHFLVQGEAIRLAKSITFKVQAESQLPSDGTSDGTQKLRIERGRALLPALQELLHQNAALKRTRPRKKQESSRTALLARAALKKVFAAVQAKKVQGARQASAAGTR